MKTRRMIVQNLNRSSPRSQRRKSAATFRILRFLCVLLFIYSCCPSVCCSFEPVRAELGKEIAWTGEAVPLIITLYSPGPFSGTASFDLPDLPQTAFLKTGNPMVGSEEVDDESYMTQRHEFTLYTQRSGDIVIAAFRVRFSGKKTFTSDPEPMEGTTSELRFTSKRPPGTESMGVVVSATAMKIQQTWNPVPEGDIKAGDVIVRTITRNAEGTTAMMLPPVPTDAPEGVRVYSGTPDVQDKVERGDITAIRIDTIKYQFQQSGRFRLPELTFTWWDPQQERLRSESLAGVEIDVAEAPATTPPPDEASAGQSSRWPMAMIGLMVLGFVMWLARHPVGRWVARWQAHRNHPETVAARKLRASCLANDATAAHAAWMSWLAARRVVDGSDRLEQFLAIDQQRPLRAQCHALAARLYDSASVTSQWDGKLFWRTFQEAQLRLSADVTKPFRSELPPLNPGGSPLPDVTVFSSK